MFQIRFYLNSAEINKGLLVYIRSRVLSKVVRGMALLLLVATAYSFFFDPHLIPNQWTSGWVPLVGLALFLLLIPELSFLVRKNSLHSRKRLLQEQAQFSFDHDHCKIQGDTYLIEREWTNVKKLVERTDYFIVYFTNRFIFILPKRAFNRHQLVKLREIVQSVRGIQSHFQNQGQLEHVLS